MGVLVFFFPQVGKAVHSGKITLNYSCQYFYKWYNFASIISIQGSLSSTRNWKIHKYKSKIKSLRSLLFIALLSVVVPGHLRRQNTQTPLILSSK